MDTATYLNLTLNLNLEDPVDEDLDVDVDMATTMVCVCMCVRVCVCMCVRVCKNATLRVAAPPGSKAKIELSNSAHAFSLIGSGTQLQFMHSETPLVQITKSVGNTFVHSNLVASGMALCEW